MSVRKVFRGCSDQSSRLVRILGQVQRHRRGRAIDVKLVRFRDGAGRPDRELLGENQSRHRRRETPCQRDIGVMTA